MTKEGKSTVTPKLRFPKFRSAGRWETAPLDDIAERVSTKNSDGKVTRVLTNSAEYGVLDQRDYFDRDIATAGKVDGYYIVDIGEYVYNPRTSAIAPVGPISRNNIGKGVMSPLYTVFRFTADKTDFYEHYFRSPGWHSYLRSAASTGARHDRMSITPGAFMRMPVPTPDPSEQQKIADCLTSLHEVIAAQGRKVEALKTYKRGLMQQLFPREGETLPRLRFREFRDGEEWKSRLLDQFIEEFREKSQTQDEHEVLTSARAGLVRQRGYYDNERITERDNVGFNVIPPNYLTYRSRSDDRRFYFNENTLGITGIVSTYYPVFRISGGSNKFFIELLSHHSDLVGKRSVGTSQTVLSLNELRRIKLLIPVEPEQQKIADCLASLDAKFAAESEKLAVLKTHKKGLMQQLFPSSEEV